MPVHYIYLIIAVVAETIGFTALKSSAQLTRLAPSLLAFLAYAVAFYLLALTLRVMPMGIVYAIWSGLGIMLIAGIGFVVFGQKLDAAGLIGMVMIIAGILVIHLFSGTAAH